METPNTNAPKIPTSKPKDPVVPAVPAAPAEPVVVPPMFRPMDWLAMGLTFLIVWAVYIYTLAPELTLEDSGELCTGSFYAGIPHPPGYPFWSLYSWLWTAILPWGNVAWRVEMGESFAAAMGCGFVAIMVSRGSSMLIEGIEALKGITKKWETAICAVSGLVAGLLIGFDGYVWSESVAINRISLFAVPWLALVLLLMMRWSYAPNQRRFLYMAMFCYGICATIHQTLILSVMGVEVLIALVQPRLGRNLILLNAVGYLIGLACMGSVPALENMSSIEKIIFHIVGISSIGTGIWLCSYTKGVRGDWLAVVIMTFMGFLGLCFYFYEPISGMTVPPMQWGYPREVEGFFHALSRGQYEGSGARNIFQDPMRFVNQIKYLFLGLSQSFSWVFMFIGALPFLFIGRMHKRERSWIIGLSSIYLCLSVLLVYLLDVTMDRSSSDLNEVFFTASHMIFSIMIGLGLTLLVAYMATHYEKFRTWGLVGGLAGVILALLCLDDAAGKLFFGPNGGIEANIDFFMLIVLSLTLVATYISTRYVSLKTPGMLGMFVVLLLPASLVTIILLTFASLAMKVIFHTPLYPDEPVLGLSNEMISGMHTVITGAGGKVGLVDLSHWVAKAFAPHQYGLPVIANLILVLIPLIFVGALLVYRQRGPVTIVLGLFLAMPLYSSLTHWYKSEQRDHWFGYWFGHDMYTPPFGIYPEMTRDAILFGGTDPGRFCPTYMTFCESFTPHNCQPIADQKFDRRDVYVITQNALADGTYLEYLRSQYNRSKQIDQPFFSELSKYVFSLGAHTWRKVLGSAIDANADNEPDPQVRASMRQSENNVCDDIASGGLYGMVNSCLFTLLDRPFTAWGAHVEKRRRAEGVYPPKEIYIPSQEDSQQSFQTYTEDAARRQALGQLKPGEEVHEEGGRVSVSGQVAVMEINGLLCRTIFDHNPTNEFFVEESFPLDWMYPYETPAGIIMKINRNPLPELDTNVFAKDHEFWSKYSERLNGNWLTYDTTVQDIAKFVDKTYIGNNLEGFIGNPKFLRDDDGQKAFSKLRSSIAGMYAWRCSPQCPVEYRQKSKATQDALVRETDFAFKQSFAFCPYSPEAVFRYVQFLLQYGRLDDALVVAKTCLKLDPFNGQITGLIENLNQMKAQGGIPPQSESQVDQLEAAVAKNPNDMPALFNLGRTYFQMRQNDKGFAVFDRILANPAAGYNEVAAVASICAQLNNLPKLEDALKRLAALRPDQPEAYYDLAALQSVLGKPDDSLKNLKTALDENAARLHKDPKSSNLLNTNRTDSRFDPVRKLPAYQALLSQY